MVYRKGLYLGLTILLLVLWYASVSRKSGVILCWLKYPYWFSKTTTAEKFSNTELFQVHIFLCSDWMRRFTEFSKLVQQNDYCGKVFKYGVISGPYFPVFGLNAEIYGVNLRILSKCRKIRTRNNSVFGHFSRSGHKWDLKLSKDFTNFCGGFPASINMLKVNNRNITTMCEICSKLTIRHQNDINANEVIDSVLWCLYC